MRDQERQVGKCRRIIREVVENVDGWKQGCRILESAWNTGLKIIANVNSHQFLPNFSPLSLQQAFNMQQDTVLINPIYKGLLCTPILWLLCPKGSHSPVFTSNYHLSTLNCNFCVLRKAKLVSIGNLFASHCVRIMHIHRELQNAKSFLLQNPTFSGSTPCPSQVLRQIGRLREVRK